MAETLLARAGFAESAQFPKPARLARKATESPLYPLPALKLYSGTANRPLAEEIAHILGTPITSTVCRRFSDGEIFVKIEESNRGADAFVIQPTCAPVNDHLMEALILVDALRRSSARRITLVLPYYGYARQDKKLGPREPVTAKLVANLITTAGIDRVLTVDLHAEQISAFFDVPVDHLPAAPIIAEYLLGQGLCGPDVVVVSPDVGGTARARRLAERLKSPLAIIAKRRPEPNMCEVVEVIGDVSGKTVVMIDDMIDTAGSIAAGAAAMVERGAIRIFACCTHGVLSGPAIERIQAAPIEELVITNTIPVPSSAGCDKIVCLSVAPLLARAIQRIHEDRSVSEIFAQF
ncbi:MAG TPA: ribose-phosphate pyrophosphokinase [Armatimonadota bacterium]|jgi:ribose-phosphate pyrophosphokinase